MTTKKIILLFYILLLSIPAHAQIGIVRITANQANVREKPLIDSKIVFKINKGEEYEFYASEDKWYYISSKGVGGWVYYSTLELMEKDKEKKIENDKNGFIKFVRKQATKNGIIDFSKLYKDEWYVVTSSSNVNFYFNPAKASRKGNVVTIWGKSTEIKSEKIISTVQWQFNCQNQKHRMIAGVEYMRPIDFPDGRVEYFSTSADSWETPKAEFRMAMPETIGESLLKEACNL